MGRPGRCRAGRPRDVSAAGGSRVAIGPCRSGRDGWEPEPVRPRLTRREASAPKSGPKRPHMPQHVPCPRELAHGLEGPGPGIAHAARG